MSLIRHRRTLFPLGGLVAASTLLPLVHEPVPFALAVAAVVGGLVAGFVATPLVSRGSSMWPTLGTWSAGVLLAPWLAPARPGHVVVAWDTDRLLAKRLLAVGAETVRGAAGALWVDGHPAAGRGCRLPVDLTLLDRDVVQEVPLGAGEVFLVGDHVSSSDSRVRGPVPAAAVLGRYVALLQFGAPAAWVPSGADAADLTAALAADHPHRAQLAALVGAPGFAPGQLGLLLWWSFSALGQPDRALAVLERRLLAERDPTDRGTWVHLLSREYTEAERWDDVARVTTEPVPPTHPFGPPIAARRALACARLRRWADALAAAESVPEGAVRGAELGPRLAALVALGRVDEAERLADAVTARRGWATGWHAPWYAAYVAVARSDLERAAKLVLAALALGMEDREAVRTHPLLEPLRGSPHWVAVAAALGPG